MGGVGGRAGGPRPGEGREAGRKIVRCLHDADAAVQHAHLLAARRPHRVQDLCALRAWVLICVPARALAHASSLACVRWLARVRACMACNRTHPPVRAESLMRTPVRPLFGANFSSLGAFAIKHPPAHQSLVSRAQSLMPVLCRWRDRRRACTSLPFEAPACFERSNALRMRSNAPACVRMRRRASFSAAICPRVCVRKHRRHSCLARCR